MSIKKIQDLYDFYLESFLNAAFISGNEKIGVLDKFINTLEDKHSKMEYLKVWKTYLIKVIDEPNTEYPFPNAAKRTLEREIEEDMSEANSIVYTKLTIPLSRWDSFYPNCINKVYSAAGIDKKLSNKKIREVLLNMGNWNTFKNAEYYVKPLKWIDETIKDLETKVEKGDRIKVNLSASELIYLIDLLHKNQIITLPPTSNISSAKDFNQNKTCNILLQAFDIKNNKGEEITPENLSKLFQRNSANENAKLNIEMGVKTISRSLKSPKDE